MPMLNLIESVTQALSYELEHDENVVVFGDRWTSGAFW